MAHIPLPNTTVPNANPLDQFLTPEAMLTPGVAGATAMMITNALGTNFEMSRAWTALILSFTFGLLAIVANKPIYIKLLFYVLNSLVIFCVASGANSIGVRSQTASLIYSAFAQSAPSDQDIKACTEIYSLIASKLSELNNAKATDSSGESTRRLYAEYNSLIVKGKSINGCGTLGGPNSVINNPSQLTGDDRVTNNPSSPAGRKFGPFFQHW